MNELLARCPVCGKKPKVKIDYGYEASGFGGWVIIQCKPLFRKPHKRVEAGRSTNDRALKVAMLHWNGEDWSGV